MTPRPHASEPARPTTRNTIDPARRLGRGPVEVIVVAGLLGFAAVLALMALPRSREKARAAGCQRNLMQVGVGLQIYHQAVGHYPTVPDPLGSKDGGPIRAMLEALVIPDLLELNDPSRPPKPTGSPPRGSRIPGLACPSDPNAMSGRSDPVISYRANTGDDPTGRNGPFEPGRAINSTRVEAADGLAFTVAFAERLVGDRRDGQPAGWNYATAPADLLRPDGPYPPTDRWRGDAGSDWAEASWRSTLYNHALTPGGGPSVVADDGRLALIGASSGHVNRVHVLMLDGSVRPVATTINPMVWAGMATIGEPAPSLTR